MKISSILKNKYYCIGKMQDEYILYKYISGIKSNTMEISRSNDLAKLSTDLISIVAYIESKEQQFTVVLGLQPEADVEKTLELLKQNSVGSNHRKTGIQKVMFTYPALDKEKVKQQLWDIIDTLKLKVYALAAW